MKYSLLKNKITGLLSIRNNKTLEVVIESDERFLELLKRYINNIRSSERNSVYKDLGLTKVKGSLGGTYWE